MAFYWLLLVPMAAYGISLLTAAIGFAVQSADRNEPVRITAPTVARIAREAGARVLLRLMDLFSLGSSRPIRYEPKGADLKLPPLLLVPGMTFGRASLLPLSIFLSRRGWRWIFRADRRSKDGTLASEAEHLAMQVARLMNESAASQVDIVAFSTGGLVAAWMLKHHPGIPVRKLITIGTPWAGTRMAVFGSGRAVEEIRYGSHVLDGLWPPAAQTISIYSPDDLAIVPAASASPPSASARVSSPPALLPELVRVDQGGHVDLLVSARVFRAVHTALSAQSLSIQSVTPKDPALAALGTNVLSDLPSVGEIERPKLGVPLSFGTTLVPEDAISPEDPAKGDTRPAERSHE